MIEHDFLSSQYVLKTDKQYDDVYGCFRDLFKTKTADLFLLCLNIGYKNGLKLPIETYGKTELRSNYFTTFQKTCIYSIVLSDAEMGKEIERFLDKNFQREVINFLQEYAHGGMQKLCEQVFRHNWNGTELNKGYNEYIIDIMSYALLETDVVPF
jgi:hypothetical protein